MSRNKSCPQLENKISFFDLGFRTNFIEEFNELNLTFQDRNHHIARMISAINSFKEKLIL